MNRRLRIYELWDAIEDVWIQRGVMLAAVKDAARRASAVACGHP